MLDIAPEKSSEIPTSTPLFPNDEKGPSDPQAKGSLLDRITATATGVFGKHNILWKPGRGRPRKDGSPKVSDVPVNAPATALPAGAAGSGAIPAQPFDETLIKKVVSAVIKPWRSIFDKIIFRKAVRSGMTPADAQNLVKDATVTQDELDSLSELTAICFKKYGVGEQYCPEVGLVLVVTGIAGRYALTLSAIGEKKGGEGK